MTGCEIAVLWNTDSTKALQDAELDIDVEMYEHRVMMFYRIEAISPNLSYGKEYTNIHIAGDSFICPISYKEMKENLKKVDL